MFRWLSIKSPSYSYALSIAQCAKEIEWKDFYNYNFFVPLSTNGSLLHTGLQQQGIFRVPGSQVEVNDIKNAFERG